MLIDMHQPGVETRPIKLIAGSSPFCETFFTDARVEKDDMVGPAQRRLDRRQAPAAARALRPGRQRGAVAASVASADIAKKYVGVDETGPAGRHRPALAPRRAT